ncbi:MAG: hypothetical protein QNJ97_25575 [Myxococcota bacterium]|nr:hypothetical protein [Myxococcota bacterium]
MLWIFWWECHFERYLKKIEVVIEMLGLFNCNGENPAQPVVPLILIKHKKATLRRFA